MTELSVIITAHNRPQPLIRLLDALRAQTYRDFETIVIDDGSTPPLSVTQPARAIRTEGVERSRARNIGAEQARGRIVLFLDDDLTIAPDFLALHAAAHQRWPRSLVVGRVVLADEFKRTPFGRFRQRLEDSGVPRATGVVSQRNFCTAANMSIEAEQFRRSGGFDPAIVSGEDQDFALRHSAAGLSIVYIPDAVVVHHDTADTIAKYCRRVEWANEKLLPFVRRHPSLPENIDRERVNGPAHPDIRKVMKDVLALPPMRTVLYTLARMLEKTAPNSAALQWIYRLLIGIHVRRGFLRGWKQPAAADQVQLGEAHA